MEMTAHERRVGASPRCGSRARRGGPGEEVTRQAESPTPGERLCVSESIPPIVRSISLMAGGLS